MPHNHNNKKHHNRHAHESATSSGIKDYGCWKGTPLSFTAQTLDQDKSPHITLKFSDGSGTREADINVASTDADHDLVYWLNRQYSNLTFTQQLTSLSQGFHQATDAAGQGLSLDYLRTKPALIDLSAGRVLPNSEEGPNNDILDQLEPILNDAIKAKADMYLFGSDYGTGIHDIHMNQGNESNFESAVGNDGAIFFHYANDDAHFEGVFLAFATQEVPTDDSTGKPTADAQALSSIAKGTATST
ncbi:uncharacterized protein N0V89_006468 [Didymosphaeria variabile]|uniref:Uncharacterized protein n=1 Tax=Didymosphaeria variabile TaxID=1932322 RepID=A0A9W9C8I7_9PLEO|nr:uncharacterized protein N0V89_006468 [Didymosphaeria variabile]KAJ4351129.1 hypothetical protein N0V89_006468 [Didymosphaeria variabile]